MKIGIDKIKYIKTYSANSIAELSDSQIQTIIDYFSKNPNTELPDDQDVSDIDSEEEISDDQTNASEAVSAEMMATPNSINDDSDSDDSEEEMPDDSDDDGYNGYGGYNEYGERDRGYYYRDEGKTSPMMSSIISPVTA